MTGRPISRRQALGLTGLGVAAVAAGVTGGVVSSRSGGSPPGASREPLGQPPVLAAADGRLEIELTADRGVRLAGRDTAAWGYNGTSPGPTLRLRPGDELAVRLVNRMDVPTNLHTHGLRVSPQGNSDNPFLRIDPGSSFDYLFRLPEDHPPGTHWYHPHHHGMVADQLFGGLVGALLVDGGPDLPVVEDRVLVITDTTLRPDGSVAGSSAMDRMLGREGELVLVNGQHQPVVDAVPGAAQRWRIVNASVSRVLALRLDGHELVQIARDGTFWPRPTVADLVLAPGNRADVVVRPGGPGEYPLIADPVDRGSMMGALSTGGDPVRLASLVVDGPPATTPDLPEQLPAESAAPEAVDGRRTTTFSMGMGMGGGRGPAGRGPGGMTAVVDGRPYDAARTDQRVAAGTVEEWTVVNDSPLDHPFHLHVWPFTVAATSSGAPLTGIPQDVVLVPARGWVRLRIPFTGHTGRTVYHCHILDHEDSGMMATVEVN